MIYSPPCRHLPQTPCNPHDFMLYSPQKGDTVMNTTPRFLLPVLTLANAVFLSLGMECFLNLLGIALGISLDGRTVSSQFPRFMPFCVVVGFAALLCLIGILILNFKCTQKFRITVDFWIAQYFIAVVVSFPMILLWDMLFDYLQKTF